MDRKIDFLIIGAQKAGTTSLHNYLMQHPDIFLPEAKDLQFFMDAGDYEVKEKDFELFYKKMGQEKLIGGSQVQLLYFPESAQRIFEYNPDMKLIAVLRNPIDRAYSAYWYTRRKAWECCESFETALDREPERLNGSYREHADLSYVSHGCYDEQLANLFSVFPRSNVFIGLFDDLKKDPHRFVVDILTWLGVDPTVKIDVDGRSNEAAMPRLMLLQKMIMKPPPIIRNIYHGLISKTMQHNIQKTIVSDLVNINEKSFKYPKMKPETRTRLCEYFRPHNKRLEKMINRDLSHWH